MISFDPRNDGRFEWQIRNHFWWVKNWQRNYPTIPSDCKIYWKRANFQHRFSQQVIQSNESIGWRIVKSSREAGRGSGYPIFGRCNYVGHIQWLQIWPHKSSHFTGLELVIALVWEHKRFPGFYSYSLLYKTAMWPWSRDFSIVWSFLFLPWLHIASISCSVVSSHCHDYLWVQLWFNPLDRTCW